jgi:hypothetical protein
MEVQRREALRAVQQAVRVYVRDPSPAHARQVEVAWRRIRQVDSVARWRHASERAAARETARRLSRPT